MQTFLPDPSFAQSAKYLDRMRLGKQRVEAKQIIIALERQQRGEKAGWQNHPATRMWAGYIPALAIYGEAMCDEWIRRGYNDNLRSFFSERADYPAQVQLPPWLGREDIHSSHRARLLEKFPEHYSAFGWSEVPSADGYVWPGEST